MQFLTFFSSWTKKVNPKRFNYKSILLLKNCIKKEWKNKIKIKQKVSMTIKQFTIAFNQIMLRNNLIWKGNVRERYEEEIADFFLLYKKFLFTSYKSWIVTLPMLCACDNITLGGCKAHFIWILSSHWCYQKKKRKKNESSIRSFFNDD